MRTASGATFTSWRWTLHHIDDRTKPDADIAKLVADVRRPFLAGPQFKPQINPFNGAKLTHPLDTVVGRTKVALHRMNFADHEPAAVIEGTSHIFLTDAFRREAHQLRSTMLRIVDELHQPLGRKLVRQPLHPLAAGRSHSCDLRHGEWTDHRQAAQAIGEVGRCCHLAARRREEVAERGAIRRLLPRARELKTQHRAGEQRAAGLRPLPQARRAADRQAALHVPRTVAVNRRLPALAENLDPVGVAGVERKQ